MASFHCPTSAQIKSLKVHFSPIQQGSGDPSLNNIRNIINEYIDDSHTATWFNERENNRRHGGDVVTSELIYYWMIALQIPVKFEKWHLNRLITLIKICEIKQRDPKKMKKSDIFARNKKLNDARRKRSGSKG